MIETIVSKILFTLLKLFLWLIDKLSQLFMVFSGLRSVSYGGENTTVLQVFFGSKTINNVYWGMALISIALCFGFAIFAVTRKLFDGDGRIQSSPGRILTDMLKSIFIILSMSAILNITLTATDVLMRQVNALFNNATGSSKDYTVEFTDDQLSAMGRVLLTVGNYGENPSYKSRYNLNACFNEIRPDLLYLKNQGVLDYEYPVYKYNAQNVVIGYDNSWQSVCQRLGSAADLRYELAADAYHEQVADAIEYALHVMDTDASFKPLKSFTVKGSGVSAADAPFDRIIFLTAGLDSANNKQYNGNSASLNDALRRPWYSGEKSLYDQEYEVNGQLVEWDSNAQINLDFNTDFTSYNYLIAFVLCIATTLSLLTILLNLGGRIFNLLVLYIVAPPTLASAPLDGGGKVRQWTTAFLVQMLSVFGSVIAMRLLLVFVPVIYDPELVFFPDNAVLSFIAKAALLLAAFAGAQKASGLINGILSDTAGMASAQAADFSSTAARVLGVGGAVARNMVRAAGGAAGFATKPLQNLARTGYNRTLGRAVGAWSSLGSDAASRRAEQSAQDRLAADQAYEKLRGGNGGSLPEKTPPSSDGGTSLPEKAATASAANAASGDGTSLPEKAASASAVDAAPVSGAEYAPMLSGGDGSGSVADRAASMAAQKQKEDRLADIGGRLAGQKVSAPTGGSVPRAPAMPKEGLKADPGKEARMSAMKTASFRQGSVQQRAGMLENEQAWGARHGKDGAAKTVAPTGGSIPKPPTMRDATGQSLHTQGDPDAARRQEAMKNAKSPQMRQRELDSYITNQFLRNRWTERNE